MAAELIGSVLMDRGEVRSRVMVEAFAGRRGRGP